MRSHKLRKQKLTLRSCICFYRNYAMVFVVILRMYKMPFLSSKLSSLVFWRLPTGGTRIVELEKVKSVIAEQMNISEDVIALDTLFEDLGADSLDFFQIITELEEIYDIEFDTEEADKIKTVGDAVSYIQKMIEL